MLPALLANPSVSEESLIELAPGAGRDAVEAMLNSERINGSPAILNALLTNPNLSGIQSETIRGKLEPAATAVEPEAGIAAVDTGESVGGPGEVFEGAAGDDHRGR